VSANYPFTTIEPNVGVVEVPDERLQKLAEVVRDSIAEFTLNTSKRSFADAQDDKSEGLQNDRGKRTENDRGVDPTKIKAVFDKKTVGRMGLEL